MVSIDVEPDMDTLPEIAVSAGADDSADYEAEADAGAEADSLAAWDGS